MKFKNIYKESEENVEKALLSLWTLGSHPMRNAVQEMFHNEPLMAEPVFQSTYGWETTEDDSWRQCFRDTVRDRLEIGVAHTPYAHQACSWETLLDEQTTNSIVVTSGTGSGKTECFLYPVINDIVRENDPNAVQAIFLYPLNALMADQCKRIKEMCDKFDGVKFAVYNGKTPEDPPRNNNNNGSQLISRREIRNTSPQILLSNPSMLEYILVRGKDQDFINNSRGKLRWIVIDEAHSYSGSAAVELKYQISRILDAFGMDISEVHFACTSATIGGADGVAALRDFISDLTGQDRTRIHVIGGQRSIPQLSTEELTEMLAANHIDLSADNIMQVRDQINTCSGMSLKDMWSVIHGSMDGFNTLSALEEIDRLCELYDPRNYPVLSLRAHFHMRTINGLYTCVNPNCRTNDQGVQDRKLTSITGTTCEYCNSPLLEVVQCKECGQFMISGESKNATNVVRQYVEHMGISLGLRVTDANGNDVQNANNNSVWTPFKCSEYEDGYIQPIEDAHAFRFDFERNDQELVLRQNNNGHYITLLGDHHSIKCPCCGESESSFKHFRVPVDNLNKIIGRTLLKETAPQDRQWGKYIAFTDSRQGTAIGAKNFNIESERIAAGSHLIRHLTQKRIAYPTTQRYQTAHQMYEILANQPEENQTDQIRQVMEMNLAIMQNDIESIEMREVSDWLYDGNLFNHFHGEDAQRDLYKAAITRAYLGRRSINEPSLESLGIIEIVYDGLNNINKPTVLNNYRKVDGSEFSDQDWRDFLKIGLDYVVRIGNSIQPLEPDERQYVRDGSYGYPISDHLDEGRRWPKVNLSATGRVISRQNRLVLLLCAAMGINTKEELARRVADINGVLQAAWNDLTKQENNLLTQVVQDGTGYDYSGYYGNQHKWVGYYYLDLSSASTSCKAKFLTKAWQCPKTHRLMNTLFCGYSPAMTGNISQITFDRFRVTTDEIEMPIPSSVDHREIAGWIENDERVRRLKDLGLWSDYHDYFYLSESSYIAAEHSAQQSDEKLAEYTEQFINNQLNVLNCSTTMEMGVDIGDIEVVVMDTVPPGAANYLQRAGRAGRAGQSKAVAFTLCNATPIGMKAFWNPMWALLDTNEMKMVLASPVILQRHINSFLFRHYVNEHIKGFTAVTDLKDFFGTDKDQPNHCSSFIGELQNYATNNNLRNKFHRVFGNDVVFAVTNTQHIMQAICDEYWLAMNNLTDRYNEVQTELTQNPNDDAIKRKELAILSQIIRIRKENLLSYLSENQFLPNANMPTGIVEFDHCDKIVDEKKRELRRRLVQLKKSIEQEKNSGNDPIRIRQYKKESREKSAQLEKLIDSTIVQRDVRTALNEYAPGQTIVINEKNYVSDGISLWTKQGFTRRRYLYHCENCGHTKYTSYLLEGQDLNCEACHNSTYLSVYPRLALRGMHYTEAFEPVQFRTTCTKSTTQTETTEKRYFDIRAELTGVSWGQSQRLNNLEFTSEDQGEIIYYNLGDGAGFAICSICGRATLDNWLDTPPNEVGAAHKTLDGAPCPTGEVRRHVALTGRQQTCYTAMRFYENGNLSQDKTLVMSMGVILKKALVQYLHIDENEIDFGIKNERDSVVLFIFDVNKGGCGYSMHLGDPQELQSVIDIAYNMIIGFPCNCEDDDAGEGACSHCLLDRNSFRYRDLLSKSKAYDWLITQRGNRVPIPETISAASANAQSKAENLDAILRKAVNNSNVTEIGLGVTSRAGINASDFVDLSTFVGKALNDAVHNGKIVKLYVEYDNNLEDFDSLYKLSNVRQMMPNFQVIPIRSLGNFPTLLLIRNNIGCKHIFTDEPSDRLCFASEWVSCTTRIFEDDIVPDFEQTNLPTLQSIKDSFRRQGKIVQEGDLRPINYNVSSIFRDGICHDVIEDDEVKRQIDDILRDQEVTINFSDKYVNSALGAIILAYMIKEITDTYNCDITSITLQLESYHRNWGDNYNDFNPIFKPFEDKQSCDVFLVDIFDEVLDADYLEIPNNMHHRWLKFTSPRGYVEIRPDHGIDGGWYTRTCYQDLSHMDDLSRIQISKSSHGQADVVYYVIVKKNE